MSNSPRFAAPAAWLLAAACAAALPLEAAQSASGGAHKLSLTVGANFFSAPVHSKPVYSGKVMSVSGSSVRVTGSPFWTASALGLQDTFHQYVLVLTSDASATPGNQGDWFYISGNGDDEVTLVNQLSGAVTPASSLAAGDGIEIRRLTTVGELFGVGSATTLTKDSDGGFNVADEDVIFQVSGTSFANDIIYHDGSLAPAGYYVGGAGPYDGSTVTLAPDEAAFLFRKTGSLTPVAVGELQTTALTHFIPQGGAIGLGTGFGANANLATSALVGGIVVDSDGGFNVADEDVIFQTSGTSFSTDIIYHDGSLVPAGFYSGGNPGATLNSGLGFFYFRKAGSGNLIWRQSAPTP
jgi:hypothetical protein